MSAIVSQINPTGQVGLQDRRQSLTAVLDVEHPTDQEAVSSVVVSRLELQNEN